MKNKKNETQPFLSPLLRSPDAHPFIARWAIEETT